MRAYSQPGAEAPSPEVTLDAGAYNVTETGPSGYSEFCSDQSLMVNQDVYRHQQRSGSKTDRRAPFMFMTRKTALMDLGFRAA